MAGSFCNLVQGVTIVYLRLLAIGFLLCLLPQPAWSEWYVGGYGGFSAPGSLKQTHMDKLGESLDRNLFQGAFNNPPSGTVSQTLSASDLSLKQSPLFGGKVGYFFNDRGFRWLGVELEAFTSQPTIKNQQVSTVHDITYLPNNPDATAGCQLGITCQIQQRIAGTVAVSESSMRLITVAFNVIARYPGKVFQPYAGVGVGAFYFKSSGPIDGRQVVPGLNALGGLKILVTDEWGFFLEGKYNRATITNFDPVYGLSGEYSSFNVIGGMAYHF
jgi:opacity protein-like surface antigen